MSEEAAALAAERGMEWSGWGGGKARGHIILGLFGAFFAPGLNRSMCRSSRND